MLDEQDDLTHPLGRWRRGMSDRKIKELSRQSSGSRGVPPERIQEMAEWLALQDWADTLFDEAERLEQEAIDEVLSAADVVCTTNSTAGSDLLQNQTFDTLVIDEATQATAPSCWIPMMHARRAILVGDHKQLPPTILNREAAQSGLQYTLFERLAKHHETDPEKPDSIRSLLCTQYRMHETIMGFSSRTFYDDRLEADDAVWPHTLTDLGVTPEQIAVIAPYDDQVDRLDDQIDVDGLEVDTVDGFQGRDKEVVLVSLVRSNDRGEIGFLDEPRRFNVAVTRARCKAVVVGDAGTVAVGDVFDAFIRHAEHEGRVVRLSDPRERT